MVYFGPAGETKVRQCPPPGKAFFRNLFRARSFRLLLLVILVLVVFGLFGYAWAKKTVTLVVDGRERQVDTFTRTVADLLESRGITYTTWDQIEPPPAAPVNENLTVVVKHAVHVVLAVDGQTRDVRTCQDTVGDVLKEEGVSVNPQDIVEPGLDSPVKDGITIKVVRVRSEEEVKEVPLPHSTRRETDPHLAKGLSRVVQAGRDGLEKQRWLVVYHDGEEVERRLLEREVVKKPVERVIRVGTLQQVSRGGQNIRFTRVLDAIATAYTYTGYNTASGVPPHFGVVAVDPQVIPMGSRLYVEGYGFARALDKGSAIKGNRIDVFLETKEETRRWGVRRVKVYILE